MRRRIVLFATVLAISFAATLTADTGRFTSYSTTVFRTPGQLTFNVGVSTTGMVSPGPTASPDYIYVLGGVLPTTGGTTTTAGGTGVMPRVGTGVNAFRGSFSITGLDDAASYKWITLAFGDLYGGIPTFAAFYIAYYYLYQGCLPISDFALTTPANTALRTVSCTGTTAPGGPLVGFVDSSVSTIQATLNWWYYSTSAGTFYPLVANGIAGGRIGPLSAGIPSLAWWGMFAFGASLVASGIFLIRRA